MDNKSKNSLEKPMKPPESQGNLHYLGKSEITIIRSVGDKPPQHTQADTRPGSGDMLQELRNPAEECRGMGKHQVQKAFFSSKQLQLLSSRSGNQ